MINEPGRPVHLQQFVAEYNKSSEMDARTQAVRSITNLSSEYGPDEAMHKAILITLVVIVLQDEVLCAAQTQAQAYATCQFRGPCTHRSNSAIRCASADR